MQQGQVATAQRDRLDAVEFGGGGPGVTERQERLGAEQAEPHVITAHGAVEAAREKDGDGIIDGAEVTEAVLMDLDGDGTADSVTITRTTVVDVDGDGVPDVGEVEVVEISEIPTPGEG